MALVGYGMSIGLRECDSDRVGFEFSASAVLLACTVGVVRSLCFSRCTVDHSFDPSCNTDQGVYGARESLGLNETQRRNESDVVKAWI